jgi:glutamyl-tRNA synthetase
MSDQVRVRFAPSPTGLLHIGGLRTALYNYLYARKHNGVFILRIEDTDQNRFVEGAEEDIIRSLRWAGLDYDEGPGKDGGFGPYRQSERSLVYRQYAEQLVSQDQAYYAFDSVEQLDEMRERLQKSGNPSPKYDAITRMSMTNSLTLPKEEVTRRLDAGDEYVIRLKVPRRETIRFFDEIRGWVSFESQGLDDQVLMKSDGLPTYHLANVVDDHIMEVTHVIRGEEWLSSAPKHILLYQYLGWEAPKMAHLPLIMSPAGGKLSKRKADELGLPVNVRDYVDGDYEPGALVNFLAYLGWSPGEDREIMTLDEMISEFSLDRVSKSGAIFNYQKLLWYNENYLRALPTEVILPRIRQVVESEGHHVSDDRLAQVYSQVSERLQRVQDFVVEAEVFFKAPQIYDEKAINKAWKPETPEIISAWIELVVGFEDAKWNHDDLKSASSEFLESRGLGFGKLALPLRVAITGGSTGPDLFHTIALLGKDETVSRVKNALNKLAS